MEEALEEPGTKFKEMKEMHVEHGGGEEEEEDSNDDYAEWDEPYLFVRYLDPPEPLRCPGAGYSVKAAREIEDAVYLRNCKLNEEWWELVKNDITPSALTPLNVLSEITADCATGCKCYHLRYWTPITSKTEPIHRYFAPCGMMQVFSLSLSSPLAHPVNIYGTFAVRDGLEPLRNYLFNRSRDGPATISPGCSFLPLCSPSRGMYVLQYILIDIDLWIKEERVASADKPLFRGYVELDTSVTGFETKLAGRFQGDCYGLDMHFSFLGDSIETLIEVIAEADHPSDVKMSALTSGYDDEIVLYDGTFSGRGIMSKHFVAVKKLEQLHVLMKLDGSVYTWSFQAGVGVTVAPEHPISGFACYLVVNVSFRTRGKAASAWQWSCIRNNVRVDITPP